MGEAEKWDIFIGGVKVTGRPVGSQQQAPEKIQTEEETKLERERLAQQAQAKAWREAQDQAKEKAHAKKEAFRQKMIKMAEAVDLDGILAELDPMLSDPDQRYSQAMYWISYGFEVAASKDPARLYEFLGARIAAFHGFLWVRVSAVIMNMVSKMDAEGVASCRGHLPQAVTEQWLPRLEAITRSIQENATTFARVNHALKLGGKAGNIAGAHHEHAQRPKQPGKVGGAPSHGEYKTTESTGLGHLPGTDESPPGIQTGLGSAGKPAAAA